MRDFRYVATLTAAQLVTSWVQVQLALGEARDTAERQLAAEERKKGGKVGGGGGGWGCLTRRLIAAVAGRHVLCAAACAVPTLNA